jgi:hypothetical protein
MDVMEFAAAARSALLGTEVTHARLGHGSILLIDLKSPKSSATSYLRVECAWRLDAQSKVVTASEDWRETLSMHVVGLNGRTVRDVEVSAPGLDLRVDFDKGESLKVFPIFANTEDYENWTIHTPDRKALIAGPGSKYRMTNVDAA